MTNSKFKFLIVALFAISLSLNANAQSCCSSESKEKSCHSSKSATKEGTMAVKKSTAVLTTESDTVKTETFTVYGNCGMCERTIENALKDVDGVSKGDWDRETDVMTVVYNPEIISLEDIKQKIADVGYDSDTHRAKDEVYNNLPGCCQYERPKK